ncbi:MAG: 2,3-dihydroxyphenylpropionate 1,2-dioxygenase [Burkholderiaceae bacterium]|nr:2,3-dihydroxyphenylpropionate 1,2-dioxygenase [Burkholderiaceae bacterium]
MGSLVFSAAMSHAPHITGSADRADPGQRLRFYAAADALGTQLRAARPDVLVVVASDHLTNFFGSCIPPFCVGSAASHSGPFEKWIKIPEFTVAGHPGFAAMLIERGFAQGTDLAFSQRMPLEHGVAVPLALLTPQFDIPIVPLIQNCMVPPLPSLRRCFELGQHIRRTALASTLRVAVLGTGGLSHWPGAPESGDIDTQFDQEFLALLTSQTPQRILDIPNERLDRAGFGAWEVRQWACALGAADAAPAEVLAYEAIDPWETGCAVAAFGVKPPSERHTP